MRFLSLAIFLAILLCGVLDGLAQSATRSTTSGVEFPTWSPNRTEDVELTRASQSLQLDPNLISPIQSPVNDQITLVLNETTLEEAIDQLKLESGQDIRIGDASLSLKTIDVRIKRKRLGEILEILASQVGGYSEFDSSRSCLLYTSPSPRDRTRSRMPSSA